MTTHGIGRAALMAGLGALLLVAAGAWEDAEARNRGRRGGHHHGGHHHGFHGPRFHGSVFVGPRFYVGPRVYPYYGAYYGYPRYGYGPYYYGYAAPPVVVAPPPVVVTPPPTSYVERPQPATQYWHYCRDPAGYYPDVQQCPGGWIQVAPRPQ